MTHSPTDGTGAIQVHAGRDDHRVASLAALAITIQVAESALPSPVPGLKPGLANVITVVALYRHGWSVGAQVAVLRVLGASLILGTFGSPAFVLSLSGALAAAGSLWFTVRLPATGPIGVSVVAAMTHMTAQFLVAWLWLLPVPGLVALLPVLLSFALCFGILSGIIAAGLLKPRSDATT